MNFHIYNVQYQRMIISLMYTLITVLICLTGANDDGCNEFVCGSVVSKCLLTQSCQCKLNDCYCCKDCLNCLGHLYTECCGCVDMCPQNNVTLDALTPRSEIGDIDGVPELFETLTAEDDDEQWTTIRFPMRSNLKHFEMGYHSSNIRSNTVEINTKSISSDNCTVIYLNFCVRANKCQQHCESMGANSYRWFHDGCCECVGSNCFNYGINESRCNSCPEEEHEQSLAPKGNTEEYYERSLNFDRDNLESDNMWDYED